MMKVYINNENLRGNNCESFTTINGVDIAYDCYMVNYDEDTDKIDFYYFSSTLLKKNKSLVLKKIKDMISNNNRNIKDYLSVFDFVGIKYIIRDYDDKHIVYLHNNNSNFYDFYFNASNDNNFSDLD